MEEVFADYQQMRYDLPDLSEREEPKVDSETKDVLQLLANQLCSMRKQLQLRNKQNDQLMRLYIEHKHRLKAEADRASTSVSELNKNPPVLFTLNNSFRHDFVKLIVSFDSVEPTYLLNSH